MLSKSLSTSRKYAALHQIAPDLAEFCQSIFPLIVAHSDDYGRMEGDAFTVKHVVCPASPRTLEEVGRALQELQRVRLIDLYDTDGEQVLEIVKFKPHQPGLKQREGTSRFGPAHGISRQTTANHGTFPEQNRTEQNGTEEKRTEQNSRDASEERFERFWNEYPKKVGKDAAWREWLKRSPADDLTNFIIAKVREQRASAQWLKDGGQFIPHPRTWLSQGRWQDEASPQSVNGSRRGPWRCDEHEPACYTQQECTRKALNEQRLARGQPPLEPL